MRETEEVAPSLATATGTLMGLLAPAAHDAAAAQSPSTSPLPTSPLPSSRPKVRQKALPSGHTDRMASEQRRHRNNEERGAQSRAIYSERNRAPSRTRKRGGVESEGGANE
eukprot:8963989-Pyramimonas_sp.AAC.1